MRKYFVSLSIMILCLSTQNLKAQIYIFFEGIEGEGRLASFQNSTEISSLSWEVSNSTPFQSGALATGKPNFGLVKVQKSRGGSSGLLQTSMFMGKRIPRAEIRFFKSGMQNAYLIIHLEDVLISGYEIAAASGERATENISISYGKIRTEDVIFRPDGTVLRTNKSGWDVSANRAY